MKKIGKAGEPGGPRGKWAKRILGFGGAGKKKDTKGKKKRNIVFKGPGMHAGGAINSTKKKRKSAGVANAGFGIEIK